MDEKKPFPYNLLSLICGIWFLLTGWAWSYGAAVVIAYPVGLLGIWFWRKGIVTEGQTTTNRLALIAIVAGFVSSVAACFLYK